MVQEIASLREAPGVEQLDLFSSATRESTLAGIIDDPYLKEAVEESKAPLYGAP